MTALEYAISCLKSSYRAAKSKVEKQTIKTTSCLLLRLVVVCYARLVDVGCSECINLLAYGTEIDGHSWAWMTSTWSLSLLHKFLIYPVKYVQWCDQFENINLTKPRKSIQVTVLGGTIEKKLFSFLKK